MGAPPAGAFEPAACFDCPGELLYAVARTGRTEADLARAVSGRVVRTLVPAGPASDAPARALARAAALASADGLGAELSLPSDEALAALGGELVLVAVRREDRERFEETLRGAPRAWLGVTSCAEALPGDEM